MRQTPLRQRPGTADLDRLDDAGRPVGDHNQRFPDIAAPQVLEEGRNRFVVLL